VGKASRDKGASGEREAAAFLSQWFPKAARGVSQSRGGIDGPDVEGCYGLWPEVKRVKAAVAEGWISQAEADLIISATKFPRPNVQPIALFRVDSKPFQAKTRWRVVCDAEWFFNEYVAARPWLNGSKDV
jgi:hypothetical protein